MQQNRSNHSFTSLRQVFSVTSTYSKVLRIVFVCFSLIASVALAFTVLFHVHSAAHAAPTLIQARVPQINSSDSQDPWGIAFDSSGNVWVAEPQCDPKVSTPAICTSTVTSGI